MTIPEGKRVDTLIINGAECETFLTADYRLMLEHPGRIVDGARLSMRALGVDRCIIAIEDNKPEAIEAVRVAHRAGITVRMITGDHLVTAEAIGAELGLPPEGFHVILANPPFSGRVDRDRIVEDVKVGTTTATELLFLKYMMDSLRPGGRCGVIVPEGVLFGSTGAHKELRRQLIENNRVEAVLSLPGGVFQPYSGVKTSVLFFRKGGSTDKVLFLHADNDGYKLDANHDTPIEADDLPGLVAVYHEKEANFATWQVRDPDAEWTAQWWFADAATLRANDFNLSAGRYRPLSQAAVEHRDPREILDELAAIEAEIVEEVEALKAILAERAA